MDKTELSKKEQKLIEEAELKEYENEIFDEYVGTIRGKALGTDASKLKNVYTLFKMIFNADITNTVDTSKLVLKTYYNLGRKEEMEPYVQKLDLKIKRSAALITKYLNEFVLDKPVEEQDVKKSDIEELICSCVVEKMKEVFGNKIYISSFNQNKHHSFRGEFYKQLAQKGFVKSYFSSHFYELDEPCEVVVDEDAQTWLMDTYNKIMERFCLNFNQDIKHYATTSRLASQKVAKGIIENYIKTVLSFSDTIEARLTNDSKKSEQYRKIRENFSSFATNIDRVKNFYFSYLDSLEQLKPVHVALDNFKQGKLKDEDKLNMDSFFEYAKNLCNAMNDRDETGNRYRANYFFCTDVVPSKMLFALRETLRNNYFSDQPEKVEVLDKLRYSIAKMIADFECYEKEGKVDFDSVMHFFISQGEGVYKTDLTNKDNVKILKNHIAFIVDKYELPKTNLCFHVIGKEILKGKKNPINEEIISRYFPLKQTSAKKVSLKADKFNK